MGGEPAENPDAVHTIIGGALHMALCLQGRPASAGPSCFHIKNEENLSAITIHGSRRTSSSGLRTGIGGLLPGRHGGRDMLKESNRMLAHPSGPDGNRTRLYLVEG